MIFTITKNRLVKPTIYPLIFVFYALIFCHSSCNPAGTDSSKKQDIGTDSLSTDTLVLISKKVAEKATALPILSEKVKKQVAEVLEEPTAIVDTETKLKAEDLVIKKEYDVHSLNDALNQLKPSLSRKAQKAVMNTIQMDFSSTEREEVVTGTFIGEALDSYSIRSYMNRLTMVGPYTISVKKLRRDGMGKIISLTLEEIENLNL